jgi:hypothetical protein
MIFDPSAWVHFMELVAGKLLTRVWPILRVQLAQIAMFCRPKFVSYNIPPLFWAITDYLSKEDLLNTYRRSCPLNCIVLNDEASNRYKLIIVQLIYYRVQTGSGAHLASYPMGTRGSFPGGKAAGAWSWPLTSI